MIEIDRYEKAGSSTFLTNHFSTFQVDRLMEQHFKYLGLVRQVDEKIEKEKHVSVLCSHKILS